MFFVNVTGASPIPAIISLLAGTVKLRSAIADWGYQLGNQTVHEANLMLPPDANDPYLCSYPRSLEGPLETFLPIALFVSRGNCTFKQKAEVALALQQNLTRDIQYVIIYNNDPNDLSGLVGMDSDLVIPSIGFLSITTRAAYYTFHDMISFANKTESSPYLGAANNTSWNYPITMEAHPWDSTKDIYGSSSVNSFYWLRIVLFTVLILSPCIRALYLWYMGGGRIALRRNERGRVVGLQYIRPIPYWFAPTGSERLQERGRLLTEEQVRALPEITFVPPPPTPEDEEDSVHGEAAVDESSISIDNAEKGQTMEINTEDEPEINVPPTDLPLEEITTSCTTCSICIDDFEAGERIRVLPKCHHAFHTDCIMPWLTERQGCCPLCKSRVLDSDDEEANGTAETSEAHPQNLDTQRSNRPDDSPA